MPAPPPQVDPTAAAAPPGAPPPAPLRPDRSAPGPPSQVLVDLARGGDSYAFEELVRAHQHQAYAVALRMTGDHHNAQDAVQDAFLRAWQHLDRFRGELFGTPEMVLDRKPTTTPGGKPTLRAHSKTERNALYTQALTSTVLATAKEALAVAVAADEAIVLVLRRTTPTGAPSATSGRELGAIYAARFPRTTLDSLSASSPPVPILC